MNAKRIFEIRQLCKDCERNVITADKLHVELLDECVRKRDLVDDIENVSRLECARRLMMEAAAVLREIVGSRPDAEEDI